jgi:hypothetical protein
MPKNGGANPSVFLYPEVHTVMLLIGKLDGSHTTQFEYDPQIAQISPIFLFLSA